MVNNGEFIYEILYVGNRRGTSAVSGFDLLDLDHYTTEIGNIQISLKIKILIVETNMCLLQYQDGVD